MRLHPIWILCLLLASCQSDPVDNPGTYKLPPAGLTSNDENLRAMVVNPRDLTRGRGEPTSEGVVAARAVRRELSGNRAPLPNANSLANPAMTQQQGGDHQQAGAGVSAAPTE